MKKIGTYIALYAFIAAVLGALVIGMARATDNTCADMAVQARAIMTERQYTDRHVEDMYREQITIEGKALVLGAFKQTKFKTVAFKDDAIERYTNDVFVRCLATQ